MAGSLENRGKLRELIDKLQFIGMIQQLFLHGKKNPTGKKKIFTTTTEIFEYKHKTAEINIEETHII